MNHLGGKILALKRDRALAASFRNVAIGKAAASLDETVARLTREINRLACIAAKNW